MIGAARIIRGNALALPLADASVDLIVTSPPYFGLRSYQDTPQLCDRCRELQGEGTAHSYPVTGRPDLDRNLREAWPDWDAHVAEFHQPKHYAGQLGSEPTPAEFVDALIAATREMVRVLKPSGSIFVNLGDRYSGAGPSGASYQSATTKRRAEGNGMDGNFRVSKRLASAGMDYSRKKPLPADGIPAKSLMGIPWRYALACIDDLGLILRAEIIWAKPNGLPESVTDRVRRSHETWFHFTREPRYFSAVDEIREEHSPVSIARSGRAYNAGDQFSVGTPNTLNPAQFVNPLGKLPGSVWTIPTQPLTVPPELGVDHFAAFPMEWPRRIIQGWSPAGVCTVCGQGRQPVAAVTYQTTGQMYRHNQTPGEKPSGPPTKHRSADNGAKGSSTATITGYACGCPEPTASTRPAVILDPFGGTGTTALVAKALGRIGISVDMSADYSRLATWRCTDPGQMAAALQVERPEPVSPDQLDLFSEAIP